MICMIVFSLLSSNDKDPHVEIMAGLSLENLLYFLLCTPVQVYWTIQYLTAVQLYSNHLFKENVFNITN